MRTSTLLALALVASSAFTTANAIPIQAHFTATVAVTSASPGLPAVGASINGSVTFDYDPASYGSVINCGPGCGGYSYAFDPNQFFVDLGTSQVSSPDAVLAVMDNSNDVSPGTQKDFVEFFTAVASPGILGGLSYRVGLTGPSSSFSGVDIPTVDVLNQLGQTGYFRIMARPFTTVLFARLDSFSVTQPATQIPEPPTLAMLGFGLVALLGMQRAKVRRLG